MAKPLTDLLKKENFIWSEAAELEFQELKNGMSTTPVLALVDFLYHLSWQQMHVMGELDLYWCRTKAYSLLEQRH